jgi:transposase
MSKVSPPINGLPLIHNRAAGIDIGSRFHVVAVPATLSEEPIQTFQAFTADIQRMADWLKTIGVETVVMESTGVYWVPVFEVLECAGIDVIVANARETRSVPGRKSDINDAQGCNAYMLAACYVPVSVPDELLPRYEPIFDIGNAYWIMLQRISNICKRH